MSINGSGIRDIARVLPVGTNTVITPVNPAYLKRRKKRVKGCIKRAEGDEFCSLVGSKKQQRWTGYAIDRDTGQIIAFVVGPRTDDTFKKTPALIKTSRHSREAVVLRGVGSVSALFTGSKTIHRQGEHLANRTQKPGLPHPNQALATENPMFFQKGGHARYDYRTFY